MESYSVKIYLREDFQKKDKTHPIYLRITINRKVQKIALGISTKFDSWDKKNCKIKKSDIQHLSKNLTLTSHFKKAEDILFKYRIEQKPLTFRDFHFHFSQNSVSNKYSFTDFVLKEIESDYKKNGSYETFRTRKTLINKLKDFAKGDVKFADINYDFLVKFENYMASELNNNQTTRARMFTIIKAMINRAIKLDLIKESPFIKFKFKAKLSNREFLSTDEVNRLEDLLHNPQSQNKVKSVLKPFLFSCYTEIRYRDIVNLKFKHVREYYNSNEIKKALNFTMHKTKDIIEIPLGKKASSLIREKTFDEDKLFRVFTNQYLNRSLKEAMLLANINKKICFHCARHTFATLILSNGTPIETVSKLLGHKDLKTTLIYAKILPKSKEDAITRLDQSF
jgi:integrase